MEINRFYYVVTDNKNKSKDQHNDAIYNEPTFDTDNFNLSSWNKDPLPVVTISLRGGNKYRATTVAILTCLRDSGATNTMIKIIHTKYYEHNIRSNKVEYGTATGLYCTMHDVKVPFCMP